MAQATGWMRRCTLVLVASAFTVALVWLNMAGEQQHGYWKGLMEHLAPMASLGSGSGAAARSGSSHARAGLRAGKLLPVHYVEEATNPQSSSSSSSSQLKAAGQQPHAAAGQQGNSGEAGPGGLRRLMVHWDAELPQMVHAAAHAEEEGEEDYASSPADEEDGIPSFKVQELLPGEALHVAGGWWDLQVDYSFPPTNDSFRQLNGSSCYDIAREVVQPRTHLYRRTHGPPTALPAFVPRAFWQWDGRITRQQFDAVHVSMRGEACPRCWLTSKYQIIDGHLYKQGFLSPLGLLTHDEALLLVVLHLWQLPDMDVAIHRGDGCPAEGWPLLSWNICRDRKQGGFSWPSPGVWSQALGPAQNQVYHQCLVSRYPHTSRQPRLTWQGPPSPRRPNGRLLSSLARQVEDAGEMMTSEAVMRVKYQALDAQGGHLEGEDHNRAAVLLDAGSDQLGLLAHYGTPILKQASNSTAFFEHLVAPGSMLELNHQQDLADLEARGQQLVQEWSSSPGRLIMQAEQLQGFAAALMHQVAIAEAAAYSLLMYSRKQAWKTVRDPAYMHVPFSWACSRGGTSPALPKELCAEMRARPVRR